MCLRTLAASVLLLCACLAVAVVMLAMLSAESDQSMLQESPEPITGEMQGSPSAGPCEETAPKKEVAKAPRRSARSPSAEALLAAVIADACLASAAEAGECRHGPGQCADPDRSVLGRTAMPGIDRWPGASPVPGPWRRPGSTDISLGGERDGPVGNHRRKSVIHPPVPLEGAASLPRSPASSSPRASSN